MSTEASFITALRAIATSPAARGLADDAAVLDFGNSQLVLTMDAIVEGVHFLPQDPPDTVAWKLVATNVSDIASKGAVPRGCLLTYPLAEDDSWNTAFLTGLQAACLKFATPLLGGDTVRQPAGSARSFSLVVLGEPVAGVRVPSRTDAQPGDTLWVSSTIGDSGLGLSLLLGQCDASPESRDTLIDRFRRPCPNPALGVAIAPYVNAMLDVSDGLLIDTQRLATASEVAALIELDQIPLSEALIQTIGDSRETRLNAASAGEDYCLLFSAPATAQNALLEAASHLNAKLYPVGMITQGRGLSLRSAGELVDLPPRLGYQH